MAILDWAKNIPSTTVKSATRSPTDRRRNRIRASRYRQAAIRAPKRTPTMRQENAN
jgi:hypothetical protein